MTSYVLVYPYPDTPPPSTGAGGIARPSWLPAALHWVLRSSSNRPSVWASSNQGFLKFTIVIEQSWRQLQQRHSASIIYRFFVAIASPFERTSTGSGSIPVLMVGKVANRRAGRQRLPGRLCHFAIL